MFYNKSKIMKQAWEFYRGRPSVSFGEHLKWAWQLAKFAAAEKAKPARVVELERQLRETDYLPSGMGETRRRRVAAIRAELSSLGVAA